MFKTVKKAFIKNYEQVDNPSVRFSYGTVAGVAGIISNTVLVAFKLLVGIISNSITIIADAINNLSDAGSSVVTIVGFKISQKAPDKEHPFGHARYEYITALIVAFLVFAIGLLLGYKSVIKVIEEPILNVSATGIGWYTYVVLGFAILMKILQMLLYKDFGKSINSEALKASGDDSRNDIISTVAALLSTAILHIWNLNLDGCFGIAISLFIIISSLKLIKDTIDPLLGTPPDKAFVQKLTDKIMEYPGVLGIHDLMIHNYGAASCFVIVHVEVSAKVDVMLSHELMDTIERDFRKDLGIILNIHMDPIVIDDPEVNRLHGIVFGVVHGELGLEMHDFRVVIGVKHTNLLFDVVIPFDSKETEATVIEKCQEKLKDEEKEYHFVLEVDRNYA